MKSHLGRGGVHHEENDKGKQRDDYRSDKFICV